MQKKIVLVEGRTEQLALPEYFMRIKFDVESEGIAIIPVLGKGNLAKWYRLFSIYGIPTYVVFDNDAGDDTEGTKRKDALSTIGISEKNAESAITSEDWIVEGNYCVFGSDFESSLRDNFESYEKYEAEAQDLYGDSKPIVARHVAKSLEFRENDILGLRKLIRLKWAIRRLN